MNTPTHVELLTQWTCSYSRGGGGAAAAAGKSPTSFSSPQRLKVLHISKLADQINLIAPPCQRHILSVTDSKLNARACGLHPTAKAAGILLFSSK